MKKIVAFALAAFVMSAVSFNAFAGGDVDAGKAAVQKYACASCHGDDFNSPKDPTYPKLAGQHQDYLEHALTAYQRGGDAANGRSNAIMGGMAKPLSKQEIKDIAAYLHSLPGSLVLRK
jgi:cytochrome c553